MCCGFLFFRLYLSVAVLTTVSKKLIPLIGQLWDLDYLKKRAGNSIVDVEVKDAAGTFGKGNKVRIFGEEIHLANLSLETNEVQQICEFAEERRSRNVHNDSGVIILGYVLKYLIETERR